MMRRESILGLILAAASTQAAVDLANFTVALQQLPSLAQQAVESGDVPGLSIAVVYNGTVQVSCARSPVLASYPHLRSFEIFDMAWNSKRSD
jgi:CubicO group peptidase (beta-lactamase class C family)